jgi:hypothetical protein
MSYKYSQGHERLMAIKLTSIQLLAIVSALVFSTLSANSGVNSLCTAAITGFCG